jgi:Tol biopolymer transport system component
MNIIAALAFGVGRSQLLARAVMRHFLQPRKAWRSAALVVLLVAGCGGGGGGDEPATPRTIIFSRDVGGQLDLYLIKEDGSGEQALVTARGDKTFLGVSNGKLLFDWTIITDSSERQRHLYSINADGSGITALANGSNDERFQKLTADGRVVFSRFVGNQLDLFSVKIDGTGLVPLANSADYEFFQLVTADGRVVFLLAPGGGRFELYSIKADGTGLAELAPNFDFAFIPRAIADGRIVFTRRVSADRSDLYIVNSDGTGLRQLTNQPGASIVFAGQMPSGRIVFGAGPTQGSSDVYSILADGTGVAALATGSAVEYFRAVAGDGRVLFTRERSSQDDLFSVNEDGTAEVPLANNDEQEELQFVAAGHAYFFRGSGDARDLYRVPTDGSAPAARLATKVVVESKLQFSAVSGRVVFSANTDAGHVDLYSMHLDGSGLTVLGGSSGDEWLIDVIDRGRAIFSRVAAGTSQGDIYIVNLDGTGLRPLANGPTKEIFGGIF